MHRLLIQVITSITIQPVLFLRDHYLHLSLSALAAGSGLFYFELCKVYLFITVHDENAKQRAPVLSISDVCLCTLCILLGGYLNISREFLCSLVWLNVSVSGSFKLALWDSAVYIHCKKKSSIFMWTIFVLSDCTKLNVAGVTNHRAEKTVCDCARKQPVHH